MEFTLTDENPYLLEQYEKDNYREEVLDPEKKLCYIFFSGNGLYFPNDVATFQKTILEKDRYEWQSIARAKEIRQVAGKLIFVRDIFKQWYVTGINARVNTLEKLMDFLRERTAGYETITVGNSAGGYMSVLGGVALHSVQVFNVSGQWSLYHHFNHVETDYFLRKYKDDPARSRYYDIRPIVQNAACVPQINYLWPALSDQDIEQHALLEGIPHLYSFAFRQKVHGASVRGRTLPLVLTQSPEAMQRLAAKYQDTIISPTKFMLDIAPFSWLVRETAKKTLHMMHLKTGR